MSLFSFLLGEKKKTAGVAKERLQIILAHERSGRDGNHADYLPALQRELLAVLAKYVSVTADDIKVNLERRDNLEVLQVKIELPEGAARKSGKAGGDRPADNAEPPAEGVAGRPGG